MATPPDSGKGPRIRARARGGTSGIRPEVVDALGGLERSLSEVAKWEQMLAGRAEGGPVVPALPEGYVGLSNESLEPPAIPDPDEIVDVLTDYAPSREGGLLDAARRGESETSVVDVEAPGLEDGRTGDDVVEDDAAAAGRDEDGRDEDGRGEAVALPIAPLLTEFDDGDAPTEIADGSVLWAARTVEPPSPAVVQSDEAIQRRRRNARVLSWMGAVILVAGAALWLVPDRSSDDDPNDQLPAVDATSTTRSSREILDATGTTLAPVETTEVTTATTTPTTVRQSTATTRRPSPPPATPAPTTPTSVLQPPGSIGPLPGPGPNRTVPTTPPTTQPPATTTTQPPGGGTDGGTDGDTTTGGPTTG